MTGVQTCALPICRSGSATNGLLLFLKEIMTMQSLRRTASLIGVLVATVALPQAGCQKAGSAQPAIDLSELNPNQVALTVEGMT